MNSRQGLSLLESVIAMFILISAFLVLINLFHSGLRHTPRIENQQLAVLLAERKTEEVLAWAQTTTGSGYQFDNWSTYQNVSQVPTDFPNFVVTTSVIDQAIYSSCSQFELGIPVLVGERRVLDASYKLLTVNVSWDQGASEFSLSTVVGDAARRCRATNPVVVTATSGIPGTLGRNLSVEFTAEVFDDYDDVLPDVPIIWEIGADQGNGTLTQARDGSQATFTNVVDLNGVSIYTGGQVRVVARAKVRGQIVEGRSGVIVLSP